MDEVEKYLRTLLAVYFYYPTPHSFSHSLSKVCAVLLNNFFTLTIAAWQKDTCSLYAPASPPHLTRRLIFDSCKVEVFSLSEEFHFMKSINKRGGRALKKAANSRKRGKKQRRPLSAWLLMHCFKRMTDATNKV